LPEILEVASMCPMEGGFVSGLEENDLAVDLFSVQLQLQLEASGVGRRPL
jgi:hypothetical protein